MHGPDGGAHSATHMQPGGCADPGGQKPEQLQLHTSPAAGAQASPSAPPALLALEADEFAALVDGAAREPDPPAPLDAPDDCPTVDGAPQLAVIATATIDIEKSLM